MNSELLVLPIPSPWGRKLTEDELIAAHKAPSADRALLERLTVDGLDVPEVDPLFPDLDELEELLAEAPKEHEA